MWCAVIRATNSGKVKNKASACLGFFVSETYMSWQLT